ncbi:MAG: aminotransferase class I/II-fold pyridoxal phosphate-dependent enzyme [Actinomycetales bacterium]
MTGSERATPTSGWLSDAPLYGAWRRAIDADLASFTIPGHKRRAHEVAAELGRFFDGDIPLYGGLDTVKLDGHVVEQAEAVGAEFWGGDWCRYSTGGSTHANQVATLAVAAPGATVLVARNAHRSTVTGLVLAGLEPVWLPAQIDSELGVPTGLSTDVVARALDEHPDARAVLLVEPGYLGAVSDLPAIVELAHAQDVPVVVDQAWGAHLGVHPAYPAHAITLGADLMVMSAHKTLAAWTQASVIVARTDRLDRGRLDRAFDACLSSSASGTILASIDVARALLASSAGQELLGRLVEEVAGLRADLAAAGVVTLQPERFGAGRYDPAKLVLLLGPSGHDGLALERHLQADGIPVEMADRDTVVPIVSMLDTSATIGRLRASLLTGLAAQGPVRPRPVATAAQWVLTAPAALSPREAFFAAQATLPADQAVGRVSAELIAPYPPGIPVVVPGEVLTAEVVDALRLTAAGGVRIAYAADPSLETFQVVA